MWSTSKEFGIKRFFLVQRLALRGIGIDIISIDRTFKEPILTAILNACLILILLSWTVNCWSLRNDELEKMLDALIPIFQTITCYFKISILVFKRKKMLKLVQHIFSLTRNADREERLIIADENKKDSVFSTSYFVCVMTLFVVTSVVPQIVAYGIYLRTGHLQLLMPMKFSTPFDQSQPWYFLLTACWIIVGTYFASMCTSSMDTLYTWFVHNIVAQFRVVQWKFEQAALEAYPARMELAISNCIRYHQIIINLANEFDAAFSQIIFMEFSLNGIQTCLLAYQLGNGVPLRKVPFLILFLIVMLFQFMLYCYGGQRIQDESFAVGTRVYHVFPWHRLTVRLKKMLLLTLVRGQKLCNVTGFLFIVNWKLFIWVVQNTFSMITLLRSIGDDVKT